MEIVVMMRWMRLCNSTTLLVMVGVVVAGLIVGCKSTEKGGAATTMEDYARPLGPGEKALEKVNDRALIERLAGEVYETNDALLIEALERSKVWFTKPSAKTHFPMDDVSFDRAQRTVERMIELLRSGASRDEFVRRIVDDFDIYRSVGWDRNGTVLFTGYAALEFPASRVRTAKFQYPLYKRPADLVTDEKTGKPLGRRTASGGIEPYPTRREIEKGNLLAGDELVYLADPLDAFVIHVNGSAKLDLPDGSKMYVGYAGKTDREYGSLGEAMVRRGLLKPGEVSLKRIRDYFRNNKDGLSELLYENESFVFFTEYSEGNWPAGSLNVRVTEKRSLATDKSIFPRGGPVIVDTKIPSYTGEMRPFVRMMVDQDTGGAIKAPGRADIYMGEGKAAELLAGRQKQEGRLYYLFVK